MNELSPLQKTRLSYSPRLPCIFDIFSQLKIEKNPYSFEYQDPDRLNEIFPKTFDQSLITFIKGEKRSHQKLKVGVVFSGGQAPGGHNVVTGLFDGLKKLNSSSQLYGFIGGPKGILKNQYKELTEEILENYRNQGGFDLLGSDRTKIETEEQFQKALESVTALSLDGLVIIGGDDSNTNAAYLAEYFLAKNCKTKVIGVPKTIDGDLKNSFIEVSFGFDTATKIFSDSIGNILKDALSARKYYFFIKLMGRSASHITLECALQTHPNLTLIGEEIQEKNKTLKELINEIADLVCQRAEQGKDYGAILIPEGVIEFIPEIKNLIKELNEILRSENKSIEEVENKLSDGVKECFKSLPKSVKQQLLLDRDPHGNLQVSKIETEKLFIESVKEELKSREERGTYKGKFNAHPLFFGYEGRSALPTNFDANYCYTLGHLAALLVNENQTGYLACVRNLALLPEEWEICAIPIISMMHFEKRKGVEKAVIKRALVDLNAPPFQELKRKEIEWTLADDYRSPGPIQFFGPPSFVNPITETLQLEQTQESLNAFN